MIPGNFNLPDIRRGDSYPSFSLATLSYAPSEGASAAPVAISSAVLQVRPKTNGDPTIEWNTADGTSSIVSNEGVPNEIVLNELSAEITRALAPGVFIYDLEVTLTSGQVWTVLEGTVTITRDISRP